MSEIDEKSVAEFIEYYKNTAIPNPEHYPKQLEFMIRAFLHSKRMLEVDN